jgi:hypothetical protein
MVSASLDHWQGAVRISNEIGRAATTTLPAAREHHDPIFRSVVLSADPKNREETMIHHLSIAARDPKNVAGVLAELMGGVAVPFPPNPGSFFALQLDEHGSGVEVYPAGTELRPGGDDGGGFVKKPAAERAYGPTHFALSVATRADTVETIAQREGWQCFRCNRGPFHVMEVWIENESMVEILPPEFAAEYLAFTRPDKVQGAMAAAPARPSRQQQA